MTRRKNVTGILVRDVCVFVALASIVIVLLAIATDVDWRDILGGMVVVGVGYTLVRYLRLTGRIQW